MDTYINNSYIVSVKQDYQVDICTKDENREWDNFVAQAPGGNHLQTSLWGQVKKLLGWQAVRLIIRDQQEILAGAQLLIRNYFPGASICYVTRGPVILPGYENLTDFVIQQVLEFNRKNKTNFLAIQPPINGEYMATCLANRGFHQSSLELAPTASLVVDLSPSCDEILSRMKRQTRQNIRRSAKEGITTREASRADLPQFYKIHAETSKRQNFLPYQEDYFYQLWDLFSPYGYITIIFSEYESEIVSGLLLIAFGDTVCAKILGWSGEHAERRPNDALFWSSIEWSKIHGYSYFDFEGVSREGVIAWQAEGKLPESLHRSPDFLKYGYGGEPLLLPLAYEYVPNPILRSIFRRLDLDVNGDSLGSKIIDFIRKR